MKNVTPELIAKIQRQNAETREWQDAVEGRWASYLMEDPKWWADRGVFTVEDFDRWSILCGLSDLHKDAYGFRPRGYDFDSMSTEELIQLEDRWVKDAQASYEREQEEALQRVEYFEEDVRAVMGAGAKDRATALRWMMSEEEFWSSQDLEHWVFNQGILFTDYGKKLVKELTEVVTFQREEA